MFFSDYFSEPAFIIFVTDNRCISAMSVSFSAKEQNKISVNLTLIDYRKYLDSAMIVQR
jgi:hypothetical protein